MNKDNEEKLKLLEDNLIEKLTIVKDEFINNKKELQFSIRKDVVAVQLKDILASNADIYSLRNAIEEYVNSLVR